jgi:hypothetical protein
MMVRAIITFCFILFSCRSHKEEQPVFEPPYFNLDLMTEILHNNNCYSDTSSELLAIYFQSKLVNFRVGFHEYFSANRERLRVDYFLGYETLSFQFHCMNLYYDNLNFLDDSLQNRIQMVMTIKKNENEFKVESRKS